jgi:DNA repair protein SbcC/Rad50
MRPVRLEVEGFTAFRGPTVVDFTDADLFALVGPTGAGKTSVIDALTFALYGGVPRLDDRRKVEPVISQNLTEARVRLDFTVDGVGYTAVRVVRRTRTAASTKEARLERSGEVLAGTADEVTAAVTDLLGLSFDHFITCVSLPQGQFARFLHDKPASRQDLLVKLLGLGLYERVAAVARERGKVAATRADVIASQLDHLVDATPAALDAARQRVDELAALGGRLAADKPTLDRLAAAAVEAGERAEALALQAALLGALAAPEGVDELAATLASATDARAEAAKLDAEATDALAEAEERRRALPERALLDALLADHARHAELVALRTRGRAAEGEAATGLAAAVEAEAAALAAQEAASADLDRVRVELRAQALVPELAVGEACPVCRQDVVSLPDGQHPPDLTRAEQAATAAREALARAASTVAEARTHQARVEAKLVAVTDELAEVDARLSSASSRLVALVPDLAPGPPAASPDSEAPSLFDGGASAEAADLAGVDDNDGDGDAAVIPVATVEAQVVLVDNGGVGDLDGDGGTAVVPAEAVEAQVVLVDEAERAVDAARAGERAARRAFSAADRRHRDLIGAERDARRAFDAARDTVAAHGPPAAERLDLAADWRALLAWAADRRPALDAEAAEHRAAAAGHRAEAAGLLAAVVAACEDCGVAPGRAGTAGAWPGEAVAAAHAGAEAAVRAVEGRIAEGERLRAEAAAATESHQVADALAHHLAANRFEKWLLDEALHQLVAGASEILGELSAGAYALAVDGRSGGFSVIDHTNASQPRPARTLSGGETFLASLALALALADQVAGLAARTARLEALFLDEGFGTLDPEVLDVVATALDELGARGRMVGVVTHVRELADRLPVRFEVRKVGGASTVERVDL